MALTMRPTDLDRSPAMADLDDWIVLDDGRPIGRIYQRHAPANADVTWFWSITAYVEPRVRAAHKRYGGNTRRREGGLSGQLRQMARLGNEGRIQLQPRLRRASAAWGFLNSGISPGRRLNGHCRARYGCSTRPAARNACSECRTRFRASPQLALGSMRTDVSSVTSA